MATCFRTFKGYLSLAYNLYRSNSINGEPFNFGPNTNQNFTVSQLISKLSKKWPGAKFKNQKEISPVYESGLLKLNCDKAYNKLGWEPVLDFEETIELTSEWYNLFFNQNNEVYDITLSQIKKYEQIAKEKNIAWAI